LPAIIKKQFSPFATKTTFADANTLPRLTAPLRLYGDAIMAGQNSVALSDLAVDPVAQGADQ
jgi:hypothetical protein